MNCFPAGSNIESARLEQKAVDGSILLEHHWIQLEDIVPDGNVSSGRTDPVGPALRQKPV
jgi:hypothetical protein